MSKTVPFISGDFAWRDAPALMNSELFGNDAQQGGPSLSPGRWMVNPRTRVPFVSVAVPHQGERIVSWGETFELGENQTSQLRNASYHDGDIILSAVGSGAGLNGARPATVPIPALPTVLEQNVLRFRWVDTRLVRRAYLVWQGTNYQASLLYTVSHDPVGLGKVTNPQAPVAPSGGLVVDTLQAFGFINWLPLGIGAVPNLDTLGRSLPELRPMAFLTRLFVQMDATAAATAGLTTSSNVYYLLEY